MVGTASVTLNKDMDWDVYSAAKILAGKMVNSSPWTKVCSSLHSNVSDVHSNRLKKSGNLRKAGSNRGVKDFSGVTDLLKPEQAAALLCISKKTLHRLCREGKIGHVRINDKQRGFRTDQIQDYIEGRTIQPRIDNSRSTRIHSSRKGGEKKKSIRDSKADLRKEMSQWR